mmetsp:Transcript_31195/g.60917  ORF Transcript_31195/g.60917 Transcript_31195/m.60917 type:complete len:242 (+) Transcript_31195:52-777(+)
MSSLVLGLACECLPIKSLQMCTQVCREWQSELCDRGFNFALATLALALCGSHAGEISQHLSSRVRDLSLPRLGKHDQVRRFLEASQGREPLERRTAEEWLGMMAKEPWGGVLREGAERMAWAWKNTCHFEQSGEDEQWQEREQWYRGIGTARSGVANCVAFQPGANTVASGHTCGKVVLWDVSSGSPVMDRTLQGHYRSVITVCFNQEGSMLASGSFDATVPYLRVHSTCSISEYTLLAQT